MYLVSSCLAGINCRYNGKSTKNEFVMKLMNEGRAIPVCPEQLGGLHTPRTCCEIIEDSSGKSKVIGKDGKDYTSEYLDGAKKTLAIAKALGIKKAILQSRSPSCGRAKIYDGTFSGNFKRGNGLTAELLLENGISVFTEDELEGLT